MKGFGNLGFRALGIYRTKGIGGFLKKRALSDPGNPWGVGRNLLKDPPCEARPAGAVEAFAALGCTFALSKFFSEFIVWRVQMQGSWNLFETKFQIMQVGNRCSN